MTKDKTVTMSREQFESWALGKNHPVLGFIDRHWFELGDDQFGYANEYVQGLWVAYREFAAPVVEPQCSEVNPQCSELLRTQAPVVERQEPVPYGWHVEWADSGDNYLFTKVEKRIEVLRLDSDVRVIPLFASPPAPVSVVLPERMQRTAGLTPLVESHVDGWNACLDKVKELNQ